MALNPSSDRRAFLTGIGVLGAAIAVPSAEAAGAEETPQASSLSPDRARALAQADVAPKATSGDTPAAYFVRNPGSDFMVDCLRNLGYDYVAATPGSTFRGLQESVISYAGNAKPEWITVVHEEISVALAHGYYKASGKPMAAMVHNTVGVQHASMAIYNAWADRVPLLVLTGNYADASQRTLGAEWDHSAVDDAAMLRGYIKYDDQPASLQHFSESIQRGHGLAMTAPMGPSFIVADQALQEDDGAPFPKSRPYAQPSQPTADPETIARIAKVLVNAKTPVIVADRTTRSQADVANLIALAESLQAPVSDRLARLNFPTNHHLWSQAGVGQADVILALDVGDLFGVVSEVADLPHRHAASRVKPGTVVISVDSEQLAGSGNYQDKQRFYQPDIGVAADSATLLPYLTEAVKRLMTDARRNENSARAETHRAAWMARRTADLAGAAVGWDFSPISTARMMMEIHEQIKRYDWALVNTSLFQNNWAQRLWDFTDHRQYIGGPGGGGVGYTCGAVLGAALAHRNDGVICVNVHGDGDLVMGPGFLWTAAHHNLPLLTVVHNNRAWHNETMFIQQLAGRRDRHPERGRIGTVLTEPNIDFAHVAKGFGVYAEGPISLPSELGPALARAVNVVRSGRPALVDVVSQPR